MSVSVSCPFSCFLKSSVPISVKGSVPISVFLKDSVPISAPFPPEMKPQVAERLAAYKDWYGFDSELGRHISLAYLEVEANAF